MVEWDIRTIRIPLVPPATCAGLPNRCWRCRGLTEPLGGGLACRGEPGRRRAHSESRGDGGITSAHSTFQPPGSQWCRHLAGCRAPAVADVVPAVGRGHRCPRSSLVEVVTGWFTGTEI